MDDIGAISISCARCFDTLARSLRTSSDEFQKQMLPIAIENENARYKIWAGNLGALQRGRSSLDARLRDSVVLRAAVLKFLAQLQDSLSKSAEITTGVRLPYEQCGDIPDGSDDRVEDSSDSSSDMDSGELAERLDEIKDIMEHLYRLSFKIRNTKYRSVTQKALLIKEQDLQTGKDLFSSYAIFDRRHVEERLDHLRLRPSSNKFTAEIARDSNHGLFDVLDAGDGMLHSDDFLRDRLAKAITNRRRYFAYWRRHSLKLSRVPDEQAAPDNLTPVVKPAEPISKPSTTPPISGTPGPKTMVSGTDFSMYDHSLDDQLDAETVISYATTAYDVDGKSAELPPPPPDAVSKSEFTCTYCWVVCPSKQGKGKSWQEHVRQDLQPYVCTYEKCPDGDRMYASRHAWIEHERLVHRRIWRCFKHGSFISKSKNGLLQHFLDYHKDLDGQQIENLLDLAETTVADDRRTCPFCFSIGPFYKDLYNHMAFHQEELACFAVSRSLDSNEEADSERVEGIRSAASLRSVALNFQDVDSSFGSYESYGSEVLLKKDDEPLISAAGIGDEEVVRRLLENGAEVNAQGGWNGNALQAASYEGHEKVVQILLDKYANVNTQGGEYGNALQAASLKSHERIVQILLENGADVNAQGGKYGNALQAASYEGHEKVVQILLENGADVNTKGGEYGNALQAASQGDHENVVQMLLDRGAGVLTENGALDIQLTPDAFNKLGRLYSDQGKVKVAKMMYQRALEYGELYKDEHPGARFPKRKSVSVILAKDFSIGLICAIPVEFVAVRALLDETYELQLDLHNSNDYAYGRIGAHNVVISKGEYGTASAARVASEMVSIFSNLRIALLVGVGGGAPSRRHDIRLGDVVVSAPSSDIRLGDVVISAPSSGQVLVYQYDFGKTIQSREFQQAGSLMEPPGSLWAAVAGLRASYEMKQQILEETIEKALTLRPLLRKIYERPDLKSDRLFQSEVVHRYSKEPCDPGCCNKPSDLVSRKLRDAWEDNPAVHYGLIASGESPMNDALLRDKLAAEKGILCFETEAAGLMDDLPCLVIRGICDYSDSHRNKDWQGYAAMAAAAYARDILYRISPQNVKPQEIVAKIVN